MAEIKAIETIYNGYRFRSRLEARWAVFFDALGIKYEYEKEGYDLGELGWYLPDFWLPEFRMWVEIKPSGDFKSDGKGFCHDDATEKCKKLSCTTGDAVLYVLGEPADTRWKQIYLPFTIDCGDGNCMGNAVFAKGDNGVFVLVFNLDSPEPEYYDEMSFGTYEKSCSRRIILQENSRGEFNSVIDDWVLNNFIAVYDRAELDDDISKAAIKARQARFEHGEKG